MTFRCSLLSKKGCEVVIQRLRVRNDFLLSRREVIQAVTMLPRIITRMNARSGGATRVFTLRMTDHDVEFVRCMAWPLYKGCLGSVSIAFEMAGWNTIPLMIVGEGETSPM